MANVLTIHVDDLGGKTVSKFEMRQSDQIEFVNRHPDKKLTVSIRTGPKDGSALCCGDQKFDTFTLDPGGHRRAFNICSDFEPPKTFKYTATLEESDPEDPIIIIERR